MTYPDFPPGVLFQEFTSVQAAEITFSDWLKPSPMSNSDGTPLLLCGKSPIVA